MGYFSSAISSQIIFLWIFIFIMSSLTFDLFVHVNLIGVYWSWNVSSGVISNFLWYISKWTYWFASPSVLCKFVTRVPVKCNYLFMSINFFDWSKIYFKIFTQDFVDCWIFNIEFNVSAFIDTETCTRLWCKIVCGPYPNDTYGFAYPAVFWKVRTRVSIF